MGFITSASTIYLDLHLTDYGRKKVFDSNFPTQIQFFGLSDRDIDYRLPTSTGHTVESQGGFIPGLTGDEENNNTSGINNGYRQSSMVWATPSGQRTQLQDQVVIGFDDNLDGNINYYSDLEVEVYVHDYLVLAKHLMHLHSEPHQILFEQLPFGSHTVQEFQNVFLQSFTQNSFSGNQFNTASVKQALGSVAQSHRGWFVDFYENIRVYNTNQDRLINQNVRFQPDSDTYMNNALFITGSLWNSKTQGYGPSNPNNRQVWSTKDSGGLETKGVVNFSPYTISLSSDGNKYGSGAGGFGFNMSQFGYLVLPAASTTIQSSVGSSAYYNNWDGTTFNPDYQRIKSQNNNIGFPVGFVSSYVLENLNKVNTQIINQQYQGLQNTFFEKVSHVLPTVRLNNSKNASVLGSDKFYYPIPDSVLENSNYGTLPTYTVNSISVPVHNLTRTNTPEDTLGLLLGNVEYVNNFGQNRTGNSTMGDTNFVPTFKNGVQNGARYYNLYSRLCVMNDQLFGKIINNTSNVHFPTYVENVSGFTTNNSVNGIVDDFNVTIPLKFKIYSEESKNALPASLTVKLVYNKSALLQSVGYSGQSQTNIDGSSYYRPWDKTTIRYYGELGSTLSNYTSDPSVLSVDGTNSGSKIFRKKITGNQI